MDTHTQIQTQTQTQKKIYTVKLSDKFKLLTVSIFATSSLVFNAKKNSKSEALTEVGELCGYFAFSHCWLVLKIF